jgi:acetyl-CoA C-acetyltransferase
MGKPVIVAATRTAIGKFLGGLASVRVEQLGAAVVREAITRAGIDPAQVEEVIMGNVLPAGVGQNPARQALIYGGVPNTAGAMTINKVCGSGLKAIALAAQAIRAGDAECIVAGGMESMSNAPYIVPEARTGVRMGNATFVDSMIHDGLWDKYNDFHMGLTGELVAEKYGITRAEQDAFAVASHKKAAVAIAEGRFEKEIVSIEIPQKKKDPLLFKVDESVRADSSVEALAKLRPAFKPDGGTVTAGNAPGVNDGAAAVVVMDEAAAKKAGATILCAIDGYATGGLAPEWVMMAPVEAVKKLTGKLNTKAGNYDLIELNEAFSVAAIALCREMGLDTERVNVNGGAVALGHPIGASGARILVTLLHAMESRNAKSGLAGLCLGGGNAIALSVSR